VAALPTIDWKALESLRAYYLGMGKGARDYWTDKLLSDYDQTFAARIGWKWDYVLRFLDARATNVQDLIMQEGDQAAPPGPIVDWGCGSGVASRSLLLWAKGVNTLPVLCSDRSARARRFAVARLREAAPGVTVAERDPGALPAPGLLLLSHVITELDPGALALLMPILRRSAAVIWVEPGTYAASRALIRLREELAEDFEVLAPCHHQAPCGMLAPANERHWCHHFATPPQEAFHTPLWNEFEKRLGIDWRSIPVSFLVLKRRPSPGRPTLAADSTPATPDLVIGRARQYKAFERRLVCRETGVIEEEKRYKS